VEWKTLGEVFHTRNGYTPSKTNDDFWKGGTIPWFRMDDIRASGRILNDSTLHITPQAVKKNGLFKANSIILATSATVGEHAFLQQDSLANQRFTNFEIRDSLKGQLLPKFVFYYFFLVDEWCKQHLVIGNFPSVDVQQLISLPFPVPPLRVQARIVEILDKFTQLEAQLEAELQAELEARRKQYAYYRDQLLNFSQYPPLNVNIEWKTLGEVAEIGTGKSNRQDEAEDGLYPFYVRSKNILRSSTYQFDETAIIIPGEGGIGDIFHYTEGKYALHQRAYRIKVNTENELFPKFLFYYMTNAFKPFILARCVGATATSIRKPMLADFPIPLPPLSEQRRIVDILDRFDTLTNSISEGLPKEIALRRKQYAYYRDALLSFPRPEVSA
jgi:predicted type I restriction-modification enzyme S subunit